MKTELFTVRCFRDGHYPNAQPRFRLKVELYQAEPIETGDVPPMVRVVSTYEVTVTSPKQGWDTAHKFLAERGAFE